MNNKNISTNKPNVIWIVADQLRAQALSCNGDPNVNTPNIDNLSSQGINFTKAVSGDPLCCPFRGSMLTSKYPHKCVKGHEYQMPKELPTIATVFNKENYKTAYFGKWHVDGFKEATGRGAMHIVPPDRRGEFQHWVGFENNNSQWDSWVHGGEGENAFHYRLPGYETDELTNLFIDYLEDRGKDKKENNQNPFFAVLSVQPPHDPYIAPEEYRKKFNPQQLQLRSNVPMVARVQDQARRELSGYYSMIENLDWNVGRIIEVLREQDLLFNTHIIFFSDHGDMHGSHGQFRKTSPYEESMRIPFIISGEQPMYYNNRGAGNVTVPINHVDIAPTTLGLCGIEKPKWMEGIDYSHYRIQTNESYDEPDSAFIQSVVPTKHFDSVNKAWRSIVTKDGWKYACFEGMSWLMFNLNEDPYEQVNLAHNQLYLEQRKKLIKELENWIEKTGDTFKMPQE